MELLGIYFILLVYIFTAVYVVKNSTMPKLRKYVFNQPNYYRFGWAIGFLILLPMGLYFGLILGMFIFMLLGFFIAGELGSWLFFFYGFFFALLLSDFGASIGAQLSKRIMTGKW